MPKRGLFITVEGGENSGKSTQATMLRDHLSGLGIEALLVREPGGTPLGEALRHILLDPAHSDMVPEAEVLLYAAARSQLVTDVIEPALQEGILVISDRYVHSSLAYQGYGLGLDVGWIRELNARVTGNLMPDMIILFDLRLHQNSPEKDRIESRPVSFHRRVGDGYRELAIEERDRFFVVEDSLTAEQIHTLVASAVENLLNRSDR